MFFGARKQVFLTFGPWVLIKVYGKEAHDLAQLFIIAALLGLGFKPLAGMAIDRFGERTVLILDGLLLNLVCIGYGFAHHLTSTESAAMVLASTCFVLDNLLFALGTGRAVYVSRLSESPQELTSTLSVSISINHVISMIIPTFAGMLWALFGHESVFAAAAVLALVIAATATFVPRRSHWEQKSSTKH
ncbi:MAG: MFS transporter [Candidatus Sumerlaeota bacterium]